MSREGRDPALLALMEQIARARGFRCDAYKQGCLRRRLAVRMRARGTHTYGQYAALLRTDAGEYDRLLATITINVSQFYRNPATWDAIAATVLPRLWERRGGAVRCWSAGCASGEEPYTLALLLLEQARRTAEAKPTARIDASDYDRASLARAAEARYPGTAFRSLPADLRRRYMQGDSPAAPRPEVRRLVHFGPHDLTQDPPPHPPYDLILCRNVIIYFERPTQERICDMLAHALAPGGYLVLGKVETLCGAARGRLVLENARERVYCHP